MRVGKIITDKLTANLGSFKKVELQDEDTGEIYCVKIKNGELISTPGNCAEPSTTLEPDQELSIMNQGLSNTASENDQTIIETPSPKPESELTTSDVAEPTPEATPEITPEPELTTSDVAEPTPVPELSQ